MDEGAVEKSKILTGRDVQAGDVVLGLASSGVHSNGFSLVRKCIDRAAGQLPATLDGKPLRDALMAPTPGDITFAVARQRLKGGLAVTDTEVKRAMALAFRHLKIVCEPGGAVGIAAVMTGRMPIKGRTVVVVASGGNVDATLFREALGAA